MNTNPEVPADPSQIIQEYIQDGYFNPQILEHLSDDQLRNLLATTLEIKSQLTSLTVEAKRILKQREVKAEEGIESILTVVETRKLFQEFYVQNYRGKRNSTSSPFNAMYSAGIPMNGKDLKFNILTHH